MGFGFLTLVAIFAVLTGLGILVRKDGFLLVHRGKATDPTRIRWR